MKTPITFLATIPLLQSAIQVAGDGGARVKLDIPERDMAAVVQLLDLRGAIIKVTVEQAEEPTAEKRAWLS